MYPKCKGSEYSDSMDMAQNPFKDWYFSTIAMAQAINRTAYLANKFENKISAYPLDKKEVQEFVNAVKPNVEVDESDE